MNVLHVISGMAPRNGGPAFAMLGLASAQARAGLGVTIVTTFQENDDVGLCTKAEAAGARVIRVGPVRTKLALHPAMNRVVDDAVRSADVVHIHNLWEQVQHVAATAARRHGKPYIIRPCGMLDPWSLRQSRLRKKLMLALRVKRDLNGAAALHFTSAIERDLTAPLRLKAPSIVEPNGVDLDTSRRYTREDLRRRFPQIASDGSVVVFLSRLHPKKGVDILIDAFDRVLRAWDGSQPRPSLLVAGPDEANTRAGLEAQVSRLGREKDIHFVGLLTGEDKLIALSGADLFCLPSYQENFGVAVVEALAAGTPVVISDQVNIYREIEEAGVGQATPVEAGAVAAALKAWLGDSTLREAAAVKASAWAREQYDWDQIAKRWATYLYPSLIKSGSGSAAPPA